MDHNLVHQLVRQWQENRDESAATDLYKLCLGYINYWVHKKFYTCNSYLQDEQKSAANEAFYKALDTYNGRVKFVTYLSCCLKNAILSIRQKHKQMMDETTANYSGDERFRFSENIIAPIINSDLSEYFSNLEPRSSQIMRMRFVESKTRKEIGQVVGLTKSSITEIINNSLEKIRKDLRIKKIVNM